MQNLARFWTTLKFGGEYLQNGWRYSKLDKYFIYRDSSCIRRNKSGEVWSSNLGDVDVELYPPKVPFFENHVLTPRGCCAPKFLHALENDQVLLAHPPPGTGASLQFFFKGGKNEIQWITTFLIRIPGLGLQSLQQCTQVTEVIRYDMKSLISAAPWWITSRQVQLLARSSTLKSPFPFQSNISTCKSFWTPLVPHRTKCVTSELVQIHQTV